MRGEFRDAACRVIVDAAEHVDEVGFGVDTEHAAVFHEGEHHGRARSGICVPNEEPVLGTEFDGAQGVFGEVVVDA